MNSLPDASKPARIETVLVLEDDVLVRIPICQYLRDYGYRVLEAASAGEATIILQKQDIHVDVILSNIEMRGTMNGFAFARWARSTRPGVDIVLAGTAERAAYAAHQLCEQGADAHEVLRSRDSAGPDQAATRGSGEPRRELIGHQGRGGLWTAKENRHGWTAKEIHQAILTTFEASSRCRSP